MTESKVPSPDENPGPLTVAVFVFNVQTTAKVI